MKIHFLFTIVAVQIFIFQFMSLRLLNAVPGYLFGSAELPAGAESAVSDYKRTVGRWSYRVGGGLLAVMTLCAYVLPFTKGVPALLAVTATSLLSSGFFLWTVLRARSAAEKITELLPDTGKRVASLERRELGHYYNAAWEIVPFVILAASVVLTLWALPRLGQPYPLSFDADGIPGEWGEGTGRFLAVLLLQGAVAFGLLLMTLWGMRTRPALSPTVSAAAYDPEEAGRITEEIRGRKLRFLMAVKIALAVQFALVLFVKIETALGVALPLWARESPWVATIFLLVLFARFVSRVARDRR